MESRSGSRSPRLSCEVIPESPPPVPSNPTPVVSVDKDDSPYLRLASSSVGLTPLMRKPPMMEQKPKLIGNLQSLSIFSDKQRVRTTVKPLMKSSSIMPLMVEKENVQHKANCPAFGMISISSAKSDKFKIENRLKTGAIKRPTPYTSK